MRTLAILTLIFAIPVAKGTFQPAREADFWRSTGIDLAFARRFISNDFCYREDRFLESCRRALTMVTRKLRLGNDPNFIRLNEASLVKPVMDFDQALDVLNSQPWSYPTEMIFAQMVNEQLHTFDAHAKLIPGDYFRLSAGQSSQDVVDVGLDLEITAAGVFVRRVEPFSSASAARLQLHDRVISVDGEKVEPNLKATLALARLNRRSQIPVKVEIERKGQVFTVELKPALMSRQDLQSEMSPVGRGRHLILLLRRFSEGTCERVEQAVYRAKGASAVIFDLRENPGGLLKEALCVASLFAGKGATIDRHVVSQAIPPEFGFQLFTKDIEQVEEFKPESALFPNLPVVLLVSARTKSAAEVLAAILQDSRRGWVVGEPTFGKGTTQLVTDVPFQPGLRLRYTFTVYRRPDGSTFQIYGVKPNFIEPFRPGARDSERTFFREADWEPKALPPESTVAWRETRPQDVARIQACIRKGGLDRSMRERLGQEDQQKAFALALLSCERTKSNIRSAVQD